MTSSSGQGTIWYQREVSLSVKARGCHLVTDEVLSHTPELKEIKIGTIQLFIKHTSASLALNEEWTPDESVEMDTFNRIPQELKPVQKDDKSQTIPTLLKASVLGSNLTIPIKDGALITGPWQGIWLCEHRNRAGPRNVVVTIQGAKFP